MYLAEKTGKLFPQDMRKRYEVIQWLMFQMGGVGPMFGQANFFFRLSEKVPYAIDRYHKEALRLYKVLDQQLGKKEYLAGEYTIADIATYPWVWRHEMHQVKLEEFPNVKRWYDAISARPAVQRGMQIPESVEAAMKRLASQRTLRIEDRGWRMAFHPRMSCQQSEQ